MKKTDLQNMYNKYKGTAKGNYTTATWNTFQSALKTAKSTIDNKKATQKQVDDAKTALQKAYNGLKREPTPTPSVNKKDLQILYDKYKGTAKGTYITTTWDKFQAALKSAKSVLDNSKATQAQVNSAKDSLQSSFTGLKKETQQYTIIVKYVDADQKEIKKAETTKVKQGEPFKATAPVIEEYELQGEETQTIDSVSSNQTLVFTYKKLDQVAFTGRAYAANNQLIKNGEIKLSLNNTVIETLTTDDEGYFYTHLVLEKTYTLNDKDFEVTVAANGLNDFTIVNKTGKIDTGNVLAEENGSAEIPASTITLEKEESNYQLSEDFSELTIDDSAGLNVGDVLYLEPQENYLGGLGLKVITVETINGQSVAQVEQAELEEVVTTIQGEVSDAAITQGNFFPAEGVTVDSPRLRAQSAGLSTGIQFKAGGFSFDGKLKVSGSMDAKVDINPLFLGNATIKAKPKLSVSLDGEMALSGKQETITKNIGTIYIPSGIPAVTVNVPVDLVFSIDGTVKVEFGVASTLTVNVGYEKGNIIADHKIETTADSSVKGKITVKAGVQGSVSLAVLTKIEGIKLSVGAGVKCSTGIEYLIDRPILKVTGDIGAYANFKYSFPVLGVLGEHFSNETTLYEDDWKLKAIDKDFDLSPSDYPPYDSLDFKNLKKSLQEAIMIIENPDDYENDAAYQTLTQKMSGSGDLLRGYSVKELIEKLDMDKDFNDKNGNRYFVDQGYINKLQNSVDTLISKTTSKNNQQNDGDYLTYYLKSDTNEAVISGFKKGREKSELAIPDAIDNYPVTTIGMGAFQYQQITSVKIPKSIKKIEWAAFYGNQLKVLVIPNSFTEMRVSIILCKF